MLLHLASDEKFIDHVIDVFEIVNPGNNVYIIPLEDKEEPKFLKRRGINILIGDLNGEHIQHALALMDTYSAVIVHNLFDKYKFDVIKAAPVNVYFHWMCWGGDLYGLPALQYEMYGPETYKYMASELGFRWRLGQIVRSKFKGISNVLNRFRSKQNTGVLSIAGRIRSVSTVIPFDYELIKEHISSKIKYLPFKYMTIEDALQGKEKELCEGMNFLVGNSATSTNNHLDAFQMLKGAIGNNKEVFCPLSYGNTEYADVVERHGVKTFGSAFNSLRTFLPLDKYNDMLSRCGNVVMFHKRQQAVGNIIIALWKGARVFLHPENPVYKYLKEAGVQVFSVHELYMEEKLPDFESLARINRKGLIGLYGRENVLAEAKQLSDYLKANLDAAQKKRPN